MQCFTEVCVISGARDLLVLVYRLNRERVNRKENLRSKHIGSRVSDFPYMLLSTATVYSKMAMMHRNIAVM